MKYFMETTGTIPKGHGFRHFDTTHLCWLALFLVLALVLCAAYRRWGETGKRRFRYVMASLIVADELFKVVFLVIGGRYTINYLPLHLCSINIVLIAVHAVRPTKTLDNFLYAIGLPTAVMALLFPTWTKLPVLNFSHLHSFSLHILLALYPLVLAVGGTIRPRARQIGRCLLLLVALAVPVYIFNGLFDTNFMFLMSADKGNPLYWFAQHWGSHLWGYPVLGAALLSVMYLPVELYCAWCTHHIRHTHA
jgi:hypothetical integral membrane protein (TIGR02206 family)